MNWDENAYIATQQNLCYNNIRLHLELWISLSTNVGIIITVNI